MERNKADKISGRDHYQQIYQTELDAEAEWLRRSAIEKVNSIEYLLSRNNIKPKTLLELGCGTGAVISECEKRKVAEEYYAVDYSEEAIGFLKKTSPGIKTFAADITQHKLSLDGRFIDVIILSHVLEHLEEPNLFLGHLKYMNFSYLIVEVPLEDLLYGKLKALIRNTRGNDKAGHVQFFGRESFRELLFSTGFNILDERRYVPIVDLDTIKFICSKDGLGKSKYLEMMFTWNLLPKMLKPLWSRFFSAHYAALCEKKDKDTLLGQ